ncbi:zinc metalloprotease [Spongiivirga citrea]|uniref:Zinc metalloprotease n=1 Tax=Spongiivirga citrea TaxID=1481457 RepID=A0A6M0CNK8_9FLAO|nr:zinc metalloprotease [Spongiivirga citrea]NER17047.1 zinc metalloprotease [Spongiivirga citrea]
MKKVILGMAALALLFVACKDDQSDLPDPQEIAVDMSDFYLYTDAASTSKGDKGNGRDCQSMSVLNRNLDANPGLFKKMYDIEKQVRQFIAAKKPSNPGNGGGPGGGDDGGGSPVDDGLGSLTIPVVVHVIYSNSNENISDTQIRSQIDVLNRDFNATNNDVNQVPQEFADRVANSDINFSLAQTIRVSSTRTSWGTRDDMKSSANGGSDAVDPANFMNIWVCNIGGGILGYAQFPGGNASTDGIVVSPQYFGTTGFVSAPFDGGRTTTHEVGHYLNLRHIWGDGRCNRDDFVADTPTSDAPNYSCPSYPTVNCRSNDMTMNYMDYVDDACMYMFSEGQKARMRALFAAGGARADLVN